MKHRRISGSYIKGEDMQKNELEWKKINLSIVLILLMAITVYSNTENIQYVEYSTQGHPKSMEINLSLEYPKSWNRSEAFGRHIVQKFTKIIDDNSFAMCLIQIIDLHSIFNLSSREVTSEYIFNEKNWLKIMQNENYEIIKIERNQKVGRPDAVILGYLKSKINDEDKHQYILNYNYIRSGKLILVTFKTVSSSKENARELFDSHEEISDYISSSIILDDEIGLNSIEAVFGKYLWLKLIISIVLIVLIGMFPPVLIRYVIRKKSLSKSSARLLSIAFGILNYFIFLAIGFMAPLLAVIIIVFASYRIYTQKEAVIKSVSELDK